MATLVERQKVTVALRRQCYQLDFALVLFDNHECYLLGSLKAEASIFVPVNKLFTRIPASNRNASICKRVASPGHFYPLK